MADKKSGSEPASKPTVVSETAKALKSVADSHAVLSNGSNGEFRIDASLTGTAKDAAKTAIMAHTQRKLCRAGHLVIVTCDSTAPGKASYYFDFSTDKGKERVVVGVTMDNDRAAYVLKRAESFRQSILNKVKGVFE